MILIFGDMKCYEKTDQIYSQAVEAGYMNEDDKNKSVELFNQGYKSLSKEEMNDVVKIDSSLAAMQLMLVARVHGYDTNPIGGFEKDQLAEAFGLDPNRYVPVIIVAIGKADHAGQKSPRLDVKEITDFK